MTYDGAIGVVCSNIDGKHSKNIIICIYNI